ncbi:MAG: CehA/McbA family metallohydrolase [Candidatus Solibacter usitatus]|nr:CehA/McbA family metallohydrolase [Candidatus Solibacter usitatus]
MDLSVTTQGKPTAARVYILDVAGKALSIPNAVSYIRRNETHSIVDGGKRFTLPAGMYTIRAEKGTEFLPSSQSIDVPAQGLTRVHLDLPRFVDMNARGWYSGDLHIHRSPIEMPLLARAEELNVSPVITRHLGGPRAADAAYPAQAMAPSDATHLVSVQNQEIERLQRGHGAIDLLNAPTAAAARMMTHYPMEVDFARAARAEGAFADAEKPIWKHVPVTLALGQVDAIGVVNNHFHPNGMLLDAETYGSMEREKPEYKTIAGFAQWMLDLYSSFLNCGFRIPVSAGSASGVMPSWPGYERVYVHLDGPFTYERWFARLKAGASFATNGPLLFVTANGKQPGSEFQWSKPTKVRLSIETRSQASIERIEVVLNGEVIRRLHPRSSTFQQTISINVAKPGWLAVRCFEPVTNTIRYAHTTPFWFPQNGKLPAQPADARRWAEFVRHLAATLSPSDYLSAEDHRAASSAYRQAIEFYEGLIASK